MDNLSSRHNVYRGRRQRKGSPNLNNSFSSIMNSMKFLHALQSPQKNIAHNYDTDNDETGLHSILNSENREWLARQGFYNVKAGVSSKPGSNAAQKLMKALSLDATERRKAFGKSRRKQHRSLSDLQEESDETTSPKPGLHSLDNGFSFGNFTSIETSTDSFDSTDSAFKYCQGSMPEVGMLRGVGINGRRESGVILPIPLPMTEDPAITNLRKQEVEMLTSFPDADGDYFVSPPLSAQSSLEHTLTSTQLHQLSTKSSTCTLVDDGEPITDGLPSNPTNGESDTVVSENEFQQNEDGEASHTNSKNPDMDAAKEVLTLYFSADNKKFQLDPESSDSVHGVTKGDSFVSVFVCDRGQQTDITEQWTDGSEQVVDGSQQTYDSCDGSEARLNLDGMGRMESIQSDSSGFGDVDHIDLQEKVSSMGSSGESDQTNQSCATVLHSLSQDSAGWGSTNPRQVLVNPNSNRTMRKDVSIATDDVAEPKMSPLGSKSAPTVSYHQHDQDDSGNETLSDKSVVLTIELPGDWMRSNQRSSLAGEKRVVSLSYRDSLHPRSHNIDIAGDNRRDSGVMNRSSSSASEIPSASPFRHPLRNDWASTPAPISHRSELPHHYSQQYKSRSSELQSSDEFISVPYKYSFDFDHEGDARCRLSDLNQSVTSSLDGSCSSAQDDNIEYVKLMRLVNKPITFKKETRGSVPLTRYKPKHHIKTWSSIQRQQHLEEETRLMQYSIHRYKTELSILETTFLVNRQLAWDELSPDERYELEDLQHLWSEVRKEITEMEQLLASRLAGTHMGNDNYNPLLVLEVIQKMVDLIREQLYQQEINSGREDVDPPFQPSPQGPWWPEVSHQLWDIQQKVSQPPSLTEQSSLNESLNDLRQSILTEVRQELKDSTRWLHKELDAKDKELCKLRMEVMSQNLKAGHTRTKQYYESDV